MRERDSGGVETGEAGERAGEQQVKHKLIGKFSCHIFCPQQEHPNPNSLQQTSGSASWRAGAGAEGPGISPWCALIGVVVAAMVHK